MVRQIPFVIALAFMPLPPHPKKCTHVRTFLSFTSNRIHIRIYKRGKTYAIGPILHENTKRGRGNSST